MKPNLSSNDIRRQSLNVWNAQGESKWIPNAKHNAGLERGDTNVLKSSGVGKCALLVAMGPSLEKEIDTIKKYRDRVDIICCDKAFMPLVEHGIKPNYVMVADASIPLEYIEPRIKDTEGVCLLATPYANTSWTTLWRGPRFFYINVDAIESEKYFKPILKDRYRLIPASSNISNAMVVFWLDSFGQGKAMNWGGYERYYLVGYDYSWKPDGNYYAFNNPKPKRHFMNHITALDYCNNMVFSSMNLDFSSKWLMDYINNFRLPVINCSEGGILRIPYVSDLKKELSEIKSSKNIVDSVRTAYESLNHAFTAYKKAEFSFNSLKENLLWR